MRIEIIINFPDTDALIETLKKIKIKYPGVPDSVPLTDHDKTKSFLIHQYPNVEKPGYVQFIPELRGMINIVLMSSYLYCCMYW